MSVSTFGPVTRSIISAARFTAGRELVRDCGTGLTLGDAWIARRQALASKRSGNYGTRAYWLGVARELRKRRVLGSSGAPVADFLAAHSVTVAVSRDYGQTFVRELVTPASTEDGAVSHPADDPDAEVCARCRTRADWHDASDGACPDDDAPHPYSVAADKLSGADPYDAAPLAVARAIHARMLAGELDYQSALYLADTRGVGDSFYLVRTGRADFDAYRESHGH